ncbi:MAG: hypothetical protein RBG1_1C00001G1518 [candidate division Zixibacteria bacterium RBG-1]|nr:MAG: hypothetical protein RBG1_1C00001G1518 [candidate division Zixibacteria bacterium RBG-1]OGC83898.1 MAG: hypothetical protein A2V73_08580 [candidate division Zixibacteria bacterium RBG_19FT_COMBO_42_43]
MSNRIKIFLFFAHLSYFPALAQVDTAWVMRYEGVGFGEDVPTDIEVDDNGNVYVTGYSDGYITYYDYATVKYSPNGDVFWVSRYIGLNIGDWPADWASALAIDDSGNAYVTGSSFNGISYDYATIKYNLNGDTMWVRRYNGPSNGDDGASALAVDRNGNVYVTGWSWNGSTYDYTTIRYTTDGELCG